MFDITETQAFNLGFAATLIIVGIQLVGRLTRDISLGKQRAKRHAIATSSAAVLAIGTVVWGIYISVDPRLAVFLVFPAIALTFYILLVLTEKLYHFYGGKSKLQEDSTQPAKSSLSPQPAYLPASIDAQTREQQAAFWNRLGVLPHFQSTFEGDLISMITGDRVYWSKYAGEPCLAIEMSECLTITVCRFETLTRYVSIQENIATHFSPQSNLANTEPAV